MKDVIMYKNIQLKGIVKPQVSNVAFVKDVTIELNISDLKNNIGNNIYFIIPRWLAEKKHFSSCKLYGKITAVSPRGIQISYAEWFPISQLRKIHKYTGGKQTNILKFVEGWDNEI